MPRLVVDGMNVIGSRPDGWWRDRDGAVRRLLAKLQALAHTDGDDITLVLDGRPLPDVSEGEHDGVQVQHRIAGLACHRGREVVGLLALALDAAHRAWLRARHHARRLAFGRGPDAGAGHIDDHRLIFEEKLGKLF